MSVLIPDVENECTNELIDSVVRSQRSTYGRINCDIDTPPKLYIGFSMSGTGRITIVINRLEWTSSPMTYHDRGLKKSFAIGSTEL